MSQQRYLIKTSTPDFVVFAENPEEAKKKADREISKFKPQVGIDEIRELAPVDWLTEQ